MEKLKQERFDLHPVSSLERGVVVQVEGEQADGVSKHLGVSLDRDTQNKCTWLDVSASTEHSTQGALGTP